MDTTERQARSNHTSTSYVTGEPIMADNPWEVVSKAPAPTAAPAANSDPTGEHSFRTGTAAPAQANLAVPTQATPAPSQGDWEVVSKSPAPGSDDEQTDNSFAPETLAKHPVLTKWHRGIETGMQEGLGFTSPDPNNPHSLGISDIASQTWNNLKRAAIHSYENLGGALDQELSTVPAYRVDVPLRSAAAIVATPFDMIGTGLNSMANTL